MKHRFSTFSRVVMMKKIIPLILTLLTLFSSTTAQLQRKMTITEGRRYVVAFPQVWASPTEKPLPQPMMIFVGSKHDTKVTVRSIASSNDAAGISRTYTVNKNQITKIPIPTSYMNQESESIRGYGIEVVGEKPITVYTYQAWMGNGELARQLPVPSWSKNYYTMNFYLDRYGAGSNGKYRPSQTLIVSAYDNTTVSFTPTVDTEGGSESPSTPKGSTTTVVLDKGETFLIRSKVKEIELKEFTSDMSGTLIRSSRPIGLISGHTKVAIMRYPDVLPPTSMFAAEAHFVRNNVHDAMLPIEMAGTQFVVVPAMYSPTRVTGQVSAEFGIDDDKGDVVRFVATEDNTTISYLRTDGTPANIRRLNCGESHLVTSFEQPTFYQSDKPVLVGQYGKSYAKIIPPALEKGGDNTQGHPTVESGMPMLQYVPPVNRWVDYGVFHSPEGMDNFLNIVFTTNDVGKIKIDGASLSSRLGGSMRPIPGTPYSTIRSPISQGDHYIESEAGSNVKWVAWTYGSLDGLQQGRAYGTPISTNFAQDCDDSLTLKIDTLCGDWSGTINVYSDNQLCVGIFDVYLDNPVNCTLIFDEDDSNVSPNVIEYPFQIQVQDRSKPAFATLVVVTRAGTILYQQFEYKPNAVSMSTNSIDFGIIAKGDSVCNTFWVTNTGEKNFYIFNIKAKKKPNLIFVTPKDVMIKPGDTVNFDVCVKGDFTGGIIDTLVFSYASYVTPNFCYQAEPIEIKARIAEPDFYASDQNWGIIGKSQVVTKQLILTNTGDADVIVSDYNPKLTGPNFSNLRVNLPLTIKRGDRVSVNVDYTPAGTVGVQHYERVNWVTNATKTKLFSDLYGMGADAAIQITNSSWTERVIDQWQTNLGITQYLDTIYLENAGIRPANITGITLVGTDLQYFKIIDATRVPQTMSGLMKDIPVVVAFVPAEVPNTRDAERTYLAQLRVEYTVDGQPGFVEGELSGTALQPRLSATGHDFGLVQVGSINVYNVAILNVDSTLVNSLTNNTDGTMDMELYELTIPANNPFVWARNGQKTITFSPGNIVRAGNSFAWYEPVRFSPTVIGAWSVPYSVKYNGHQVVQPLLIGASEQNTELSVTNSNLINWYNHSVDGVFTALSTTDGVLEVGEPFGVDPLEFSVIGWTTANGTFNPNYKQIPVSAGIPVFIWVRFTPSAVTTGGLSAGQNLNGRLPFRTNSFVTNIEVKELVSGLVDTATITGDGKYLESTVYVPTNYTAQLGEYKDIFVYTKDVPQSLDSGYVSQFRTRLSFDPKLLYPVSIITSNTQTDSWRQVSYNILNGNMIELDLKSDAGRVLNSTDEPIYGVRFQTLLSPNTTSALPVQLYWVDLEQEGIDDRQYMVFNYEPGSIVVNTPCAGTLRLVSLGSSNYFIKSNNSIIRDNIDVEYGVGITAHVEMYLVNIMGQVITLISGSQSNGNYHFTADVSDLPSGVYYLVYKSGDYSPSPIKFVKQ